MCGVWDVELIGLSLLNVGNVGDWSRSLYVYVKDLWGCSGNGKLLGYRRRWWMVVFGAGYIGRFTAMNCSGSVS